VNSAESDLAIHDLAKMIDHPLLRPDLTEDELIEGLDLALLYDVASACIRPCDTNEARRRLEGADVRVCVAVGFPHGSHTCETKLFETKLAMDSGADEIDIVMNIGKWKSGDLAYVERELRSVIEEVTSRSGITKVILETHYLTLDEIKMVCRVIERVGADFVSNSSGYAPSNVQLKDVELLRSSLVPEIGIKIAGGVNTLDQLLTYRYAGATRVGTLATEQILSLARDRFSA
jgi:deoxyribose-phosphate aldolase